MSTVYAKNLRTTLLPKDIVDRRYQVHFVRNDAELDAVLKLRYEVFNLELGEGLDASHLTQRDCDQFDHQCHHLTVIDRDSDAVIGTYRMQTLEMVGDATGFYSAGEFDLTLLPDAVLRQAVEVGRACIAREHRSGRVLFLLWRGIAAYMERFRKRYLFGCCSLTSQNPRDGELMLAHLRNLGVLDPRHTVSPQPGYECSSGETLPAKIAVKIPQLFRLYLQYGARVCSRPAIDRLFKTIDFLVILDTAELDERTRSMFYA